MKLACWMLAFQGLLTGDRMTLDRDHGDVHSQKRCNDSSMIIYESLHFVMQEQLGCIHCPENENSGDDHLSG